MSSFSFANSRDDDCSIIPTHKKRGGVVMINPDVGDAEIRCMNRKKQKCIDMIYTLHEGIDEEKMYKKFKRNRDKIREHSLCVNCCNLLQNEETGMVIGPCGHVMCNNCHEFQNRRIHCPCCGEEVLGTCMVQTKKDNGKSYPFKATFSCPDEEQELIIDWDGGHKSLRKRKVQKASRDDRSRSRNRGSILVED